MKSRRQFNLRKSLTSKPVWACGQASSRKPPGLSYRHPRGSVGRLASSPDPLAFFWKSRRHCSLWAQPQHQWFPPWHANALVSILSVSRQTLRQAAWVLYVCRRKNGPLCPLPSIRKPHFLPVTQHKSNACHLYCCVILLLRCSTQRRGLHFCSVTFKVQFRFTRVFVSFLLGSFLPFWDLL